MAIGSGMSFTGDLAEAGALLAEGKLRRCDLSHMCKSCEHLLGLLVGGGRWA